MGQCSAGVSREPGRRWLVGRDRGSMGTTSCTTTEDTLPSRFNRRERTQSTPSTRTKNDLLGWATTRRWVEFQGGDRQSWRDLGWTHSVLQGRVEGGRSEIHQWEVPATTTLGESRRIPDVLLWCTYGDGERGLQGVSGELEKLPHQEMHGEHFVSWMSSDDSWNGITTLASTTSSRIRRSSHFLDQLGDRDFEDPMHCSYGQQEFVWHYHQDV